MSSKKEYNLTQLNPETTFERHVFHRDQFAHYLRWTHVLKKAKIGQRILDYGSGSGNLAEVFYRNRFKCKQYCGLEFRSKTVDQANLKFQNVDWIKFYQRDIIKDNLIEFGNNWDMIVSFEVAEHIGKNNIDKYLHNAWKLMNGNTIFMLSTPNYDEKVGAAANHIFDSQDGRGKVSQEFYHQELEEKIKKYFVITEKYGTFASQTHYKNIMNDWQKNMFEELNKYYDTNLLSVIMAPFFPEQARNCLWVLKAL
jgi:cyclopropane fatty-acyl-phospholipid synthase-like methyltransferase